MNLSRAIQELHAERKRIVELIQAVEAVQEHYTSQPTREKRVRRRGRKSMGQAERQQVSERMKRYWAARRDSEASQAQGAVA